MPRAYMEMIFSSKSGNRRWYLAISCGSKVPARSRGISSVTFDVPVRDRLLRSAVMAIGFSIRRFRIKMRVELRIQDTFRQPFLQLVKQTVLGEYRFRITPLQQLVQ